MPSDSPRRLVYELPRGKKAGNKHSKVSVTIGDTVFPCHPTIDGITLLEFSQLAASMPDTDGMTDEEAVAKIDPKVAAQSSAAILELLRSAFVDYDAFRAFVRLHGLDLDFLTSVMGDLVEAYTDRPTLPPEPSSGGHA